MQGKIGDTHATWSACELLSLAVKNEGKHVHTLLLFTSSPHNDTNNKIRFMYFQCLYVHTFLYMQAYLYSTF